METMHVRLVTSSDRERRTVPLTCIQSLTVSLCTLGDKEGPQHAFSALQTVALVLDA